MPTLLSSKQGPTSAEAYKLPPGMLFLPLLRLHDGQACLCYTNGSHGMPMTDQFLPCSNGSVPARANSISPALTCASAPPRMQLARFTEAAAPKDWPLCWTVLPVLQQPDSTDAGCGGTWLGLPASATSAMRLRSPPPFAVVVQHLKTVSCCCCTLRTPHNYGHACARILGKAGC